MSVDAVDHLCARAHDAGKLEDREAGGERFGGEGMAQLIRAALLDSGRFERWIPLAGAPAMTRVRPNGQRANIASFTACSANGIVMIRMNISRAARR